MSSPPALAILYENAAWAAPLFDALSRRGTPFTAVDIKAAAFDPSAPLAGARVVFNQASPSAYTRGHARAVPLALALLTALEHAGARVLNGPRAFSLELSKSAQCALLRRLGIAHPRSLAFNDAAAARRAWPAGAWPALLKPEQGGSGARMFLLQGADELDALLAARPELWAPDGLLLLQEYFALPPSRGIVRLELVGGELLYAMRVVAHGAFNLCPSVACNPDGGEGTCAPPRAAAAAPRPVEFAAVARADVPAAAVDAARRIAAEAGLDVCGIEYLEADDGRLVFYDVNANSNLRASVSEAFGAGDPFERVAEFLEGHVRAAAGGAGGAAAAP